jgi:hypothetical protein
VVLLNQVGKLNFCLFFDFSWKKSELSIKGGSPEKAGGYSLLPLNKNAHSPIENISISSTQNLPLRELGCLRLPCRSILTVCWMFRQAEAAKEEVAKGIRRDRPTSDGNVAECGVAKLDENVPGGGEKADASKKRKNRGGRDGAGREDEVVEWQVEKLLSEFEAACKENSGTQGEQYNCWRGRV